MTVFAGDPGPDYQGTLPIMVDDPVVVANSLLSRGSGIAPTPPLSGIPSRAPFQSDLGSPQIYIARPGVDAFTPVIVPFAKGGGSPSSTPDNQPHSGAFLTVLDAQGNPTTEELPWGEDEVMVSGPQSPGAGGPAWSTSGDAILNDVGAVIEGGISGAAQAADTIAQSQGYDGSTDAYPFSYGAPGHQSARGSLASTATSGAGGWLILLLIAWVIFK